MVALQTISEPTPSAFALAHHDYIEAGYPVLTIEPGHKRPGSYATGRWLAGWKVFRSSPSDDALLARMVGWPNAGIGIALGRRVGELILICLDFDTTYKVELAALLKAAPDSPMVRIGSKGEARFYLADPSIVSRQYKIGDRNILDLLAKGKQAVMPPTRHPLGMDYRWKDGFGLTKAADLPEFTAEDLARLEEELRTLGWQRRGTGKAAAPTQPDAAGELPTPANDRNDDYFGEANEAALANLSAWVHDLGLETLRAKRGGFEAVAEWRPSSTGRLLAERNRNLSLVPAGIVDFGDGPKGYPPIDVVMAATGRTPSEACEFLRQRLGLEEDEGVRIADVDRRLAEDGLLTNEGATASTITVAADGVAHDAETGEVIALSPELPTPVNDNADDRDFPEHLTHVPGLLGDMVQYIIDTSRRPNRPLALGAALVTLGTIIGRRDATPTGSGTHLYVIALAPSGAGKDHPQDAGILMLEDAVKAFGEDAEDDLVGAPDFMSQTAITNEMVERPLRASFMDEFGAFLEKVNAPRASSHEVMMKKVLLETWGKSFSAYRTPAWAGVKSKRIEAPCYSIFGASTPTRFYNALQGDDRENGFLNRMLFLPSFTKPVLRDPRYNRADIPETLSDQLRAAYRIGRQFLAPGAAPEQRPVDWVNGEAKALWDAFVKECDESDLGGFCMRSAEMAGRLATIVAVGRQVENEDPTVSVEDIRWGIEVARWSAQRMAKDAGAYVADNPVGRDRARILVKLNEAPSRQLPQSKIMQDLSFKSADLNTHVRDMVEMGQITLKKVPPANGGTAKVWLVAV